MTALDYLEEKTYVHNGVSVISEDDAYKAVDMAKKEIADWLYDRLNKQGYLEFDDIEVLKQAMKDE